MEHAEGEERGDTHCHECEEDPRHVQRCKGREEVVDWYGDEDG